MLQTLTFIKSNHLPLCGTFDGYYTAATNPYYIKFSNVVKEINSKVKSEDLTELVHDTSLHVNDYQTCG